MTERFVVFVPFYQKAVQIIFSSFDFMRRAVFFFSHSAFHVFTINILASIFPTHRISSPLSPSRSFFRFWFCLLAYSLAGWLADLLFNSQYCESVQERIQSRHWRRIFSNDIHGQTFVTYLAAVKKDAPHQKQRLTNAKFLISSTLQWKLYMSEQSIFNAAIDAFYFSNNFTFLPEFRPRFWRGDTTK